MNDIRPRKIRKQEETQTLRGTTHETGATLLDVNLRTRLTSQFITSTHLFGARHADLVGTSETNCVISL